jgi:poly(3-hydroxybutyrate) depolymerase
MIAGIVHDIKLSEARWTIDPSCIYIAGLSAGGAMASILGATYPELFAAVGVHSGLGYQAATNVIDGLRAMRRGGPDPMKQGQAAYSAMGSVARVVPVIVFHGTSDHQVHAVNGDKVVQQWLYTNHLASQGTYVASFNAPSHTEKRRVDGKRTHTVYTWADNDGREVQEYWKVDGLGHGWSGGSPGSRYVDQTGPDASLAMYQFFMKHQINVSVTAQEDGKYTFWKRLLSLPERLLKRSPSATS